MVIVFDKSERSETEILSANCRSVSMFMLRELIEVSTFPRDMFPFRRSWRFRLPPLAEILLASVSDMLPRVSASGVTSSVPEESLMLLFMMLL